MSSEGEEREACIHRGRARQYNMRAKAEVLATTPKNGRDKFRVAAID